MQTVSDIGLLNKSDLSIVEPIVKAIDETIALWHKRGTVCLGGQQIARDDYGGYSHLRILYADRKIMIDFCDAGRSTFAVSSIDADARGMYLGDASCVFSAGFPRGRLALAGPWWAIVPDVQAEIDQACRYATMAAHVRKAAKDAAAASSFAARCKEWL